MRKEILEGIAASNLVGFHNFDYARHFISACSTILSSNVLPNGIEINGNFVRIDAFPIGIEPDVFIEVTFYQIDLNAQ